MTSNTQRFHIRNIEGDDVEELAKLYSKVFCEREPVCVYINLTEEEFYESKRQAEVCVNDGVSFVCVDTTLPIGNQIVGFRLCEPLQYVSEIKLTGNEQFDWIDAFKYFKNHLEFAWFNAHPTFVTLADKPKCLKFKAVGVKSGYENHGIASKLVKHTIDNAKLKGFDYIFVAASGSVSQHIFEHKFKFKEIFRKNYKDFEYAGNYFLENITNPPQVICFELDLSKWELTSNATTNAF